MKKSLVLAMAMALGVTASAYAANPFSDVPAGHWAYDSISKLAAAGVIEGYGDDTFRGDRLMTRYEMAQIVAKAMAKGANVDKLAAEFADELDALGVRVAALEKKADNVKITGNIRYRWRVGSANAVGGSHRQSHDLRTRLTFTGKINDGWNYVGLIENNQNFRDNIGNEEDVNGGNNSFHFQRAYVQGRLGGAKITAGRYHEDLVGGDLYSNRMDGIKAEYGDKFKVMAYYGKLTAATERTATGNFNPRSNGYGIHLGYDFSKQFNLFAGYDHLSNKRMVAAANKRDAKVFDVGFKAKFNDFGFTAQYMNGNVTNRAANDKKNGYTFELTYKGANKAKPGTWGLNLKYWDQGNLTYWSPASFANANDGAVLGGLGYWPANMARGFKAWRIGGNYTVAKNMVLTLAYYDVKGKDNAANMKKARTVYTDLTMTF